MLRGADPMPLVPPPMLKRDVFGGKPVMVKVTFCPDTIGFGFMVTLGFGSIMGMKYPAASPAPIPIMAAAMAFALICFFSFFPFVFSPFVTVNLMDGGLGFGI
jgi:hypothetical protein